MEITHTPGPWTAISTRSPLGETGDYENLVSVLAGKKQVCFCYEIGEDEEEVDNARLIAAAPDMLEAIRYYFDVLREVRGEGWSKNPDHVLAKMLAAYNKVAEQA